MRSDFCGGSRIQATESFRKMAEDADLLRVTWRGRRRGGFFCPPARLAFDFVCVPCEEGPPFESALIGFECVYTIDGHVSKRTRVPDVFSFVASTGVFNQKRPAVRIITRLGSMSSRCFFFLLSSLSFF